MKKNKKNFSPETVNEIVEKYTDQYGTINCGACGRADRPFENTPHHIFFKSQLFRPCVSMAANGVLICMQCHHHIHHGGNEEETTYGRKIDIELKERAIKEFEGTIPEEDYEELISIYRKVKYKKINK